MKAGSPSFIECTAEAFLLWACVIALPGCFQEKFDYTIQMEPGSQWLWKAEVHNSLTIPAGPDQMIVTTPTSIRLNLLVQHVDGSGNYTVLAKFERFNAGLLVTVASRAISTSDLYMTDGDPLEMLRRKVPENSFRFTLSPKGGIDNVIGLDQLYTMISRELEGLRRFRNRQYPAESLEPVEQTLLMVFEDDFLPMILEMTLHTLPDDPVRVGETWGIDFTGQPPGGEPSTVLTLVSRENGVAQLRSPTMELDDDTSDGRRLNEFTQTIRLDEASGLPLQHEVHTTIDRFNSGSARASSSSTLHITAEVLRN